MPESAFNQSALSSKYLDREFTAIFASHRALDGLEQGRGETPIVLKLLGAIVNANIGALADVFVLGALVYVLKSAPSTHVVNQNIGIVSAPALNITNQVTQTIPTLDIQPTPCLI